MPRKWKAVTPALCGIADEIPVPTIKQKWNEWIAPVIYAEPQIYSCAFKVYRMVCSPTTLANRKTGCKMFIILLEDTQGFKFEHDDIAKGVFDRYWDLAKVIGHLEAKQGADPSFDKVMDEWRRMSKADIDRCEAMLCAGWPEACQE